MLVRRREELRAYPAEIRAERAVEIFFAGRVKIPMEDGPGIRMRIAQPEGCARNR
jgi:hypothetical protein